MVFNDGKYAFVRDFKEQVSLYDRFKVYSEGRFINDRN